MPVNGLWQSMAALCSADAEHHARKAMLVLQPCWLQGERNTCVMVGGEIGLIAASESGAIHQWPESDLRSAAEAAGFAVPNRRLAARKACTLRAGTAHASVVAHATMVSARSPATCLSEGGLLRRPAQLTCPADALPAARAPACGTCGPARQLLKLVQVLPGPAPTLRGPAVPCMPCHCVSLTHTDGPTAAAPGRPC